MSIIVMKFRTTIEAGRARPAPPIGPMLGQRGLNLKDFCTIFNNISNKYIEGLPISTTVLVDETNTVELVVYGATLEYILNRVTNKEREVSLKNLFKVASFLKKHDSRYKKIKIKQICFILTAVCRTKRIKVVE